MSYLAQLKKIESKKNFINSPITEVAKVPEVPLDTFDTSGTEESEKNLLLIQSWLFHIGEPEEDHYLILNKCKSDPEALAYYLERAIEREREERRTKVLAILADNPKTQRAIIADTNADPDNVILTIALRDQCSFELTIPKAKYDQFAFLELINKGKLQ